MTRPQSSSILSSRASVLVMTTGAMAVAVTLEY